MAEETMILRRWTSSVRTCDRREYIRYIEETGVADYLRTPGNLGCETLMRDCGDGRSEVTTLSWWTSMAAIHAFAGDEVDRARYYPEDDRFLLAKPERVEHHEIVVEKLGLVSPRSTP